MNARIKMYHMVMNGMIVMDSNDLSWLRRRAVKDSSALGIRITIVDDYDVIIFDTANGVGN